MKTIEIIQMCFFIYARWRCTGAQCTALVRYVTSLASASVPPDIVGCAMRLTMNKPRSAMNHYLFKARVPNRL